MKVVFSERARQDLTDIGDYIARENPKRAVTFINALKEMALKLSEMPLYFPHCRATQIAAFGDEYMAIISSSIA